MKRKTFKNIKLLRRATNFESSEIENINTIRTQIMDTVYLLSGILGAFTLYGSLMRWLKDSWHPIIAFYLFLFFYIWCVYLFRKRIALNWKAGGFAVVFFLAGFFLNITNGVISGAVQFIFISIILTLIFGWKLGIISVILTLIVRSIIAVLYIKGILKVDVDLNTHAIALPTIVSTILGAFFVGAVSVFAINKFYRWLFFSVQQLSEKAEQLTAANRELVIAKKRAEEHDRLKTVFLANMSHEIRTPMNAIIGFTTFLAKPDLPNHKRERFSNLVQERSYDLLRIIEDILDVSKIEIGQLKLVESQFKLADLLREIYEYYKLKIIKTEDKTEIGVKLNIPDEIENVIILADNMRLKQIINNLVENAIKFTCAGSIELGCENTTKGQITFFVKDTGIGIPKDKQKIIFDRFRQADESITARRFGGTGLGLSIVKGIVDLMKGRMWLISEEEKGSEFYFSIPAKLVSSTNSDNSLSLEGKKDR